MHTFLQAIRPDGERTLTVFLDSGPLVVNGEHPNYDEILAGVRGSLESDEILDLADLSQAVAKKFDAIGRRVSVANGVVYFDGDPVHNALTNHIVRALDQGADFQPLVRFYEKLAANPNEHSREQLYEWLDRRDFTILQNGNFLAYKGCARNSDGVATSISRGKAVVNGKAVDGAVPNPLGAVVEFPRSEVEWNPASGCARGLHVGDYEYASSWARGVLLKVSVDPGDVVSVPTDSNAAKVRVCRYQVLDVYDKAQPVAEAVYAEDPDDLWEEDEEEIDTFGEKCGDPGCYCANDPEYV